MNLIERFRANRCAVRGCERERMTDAAVCRDDMNELFARRLAREADGTYTRRRVFRLRDETGALRERAA